MSKNLLIPLFVILLGVSCAQSAARDEEDAQRYLDALDLYAKGDFAGALKQISVIRSTHRLLYSAALLEAKILFFSNKIEESQKKLAALSKKYPSCTEARLWQVRCALELQHIEKAQRLLDEELRFNPSDWRPYYLYSLCAAAEENYEKRLLMLNHAETHLADSAKVYAEQAKIRFALGQNERALEYVKQARAAGNGLFSDSFSALEAVVESAAAQGKQRAGGKKPAGGKSENL